MRQRVSRYTSPGINGVYAAAQQFVERALRADDSLFTPGQAIWSLERGDDLHQRLAKTPDVRSGKFEATLQQQLHDASAEMYQLAGELLYVHLLIAADGIGAASKRRLITTVLGWSSSPVSIPPDLDRALEQGVARVGSTFASYRFSQLRFLLEFVRVWKRLPQEEQHKALNDPWEFKVVVFTIPHSKAAKQREALLHLVHPDTFENIVSQEHKRRLAEEHAQYITTPTNDVDQQLAQIQEHYRREHGQPLDFYTQKQHTGTPDSLLPGSLGTDLRVYMEFVTHLGDTGYTPTQLVQRLHSTPLPAPDVLVRDLLCLRLLEPLHDGTYRRWPHLAQASQEHMLRYSALTMLVPDGTGTYQLPVRQAPLDGQPHPVAAWPYGEALLNWYSEAKLVQRNSDGTWQSLAGALEPMYDPTPIAQTINAFLRNLRLVRANQHGTGLLMDEPLPLLDPATLDERIAEIQRDLLIDRATILRMYRSLIAGHHIILSGPPGTGKTHLACLLPQVLWRDTETTTVLSLPTDPALPPDKPPVEQHMQHAGYAVDLVTATEDWGLRHVIGGIAPQLVRTDDAESGLVYTIRHGYLTRAVLSNYRGYDGAHIPPLDHLERQEFIGSDGRRYRGCWLVIDEFTRASVDAAFGGLLTTLGGQRNPLMVPAEDGRDVAVPLPRDFRIIGTLNSFDRHFLNQISEAMKRRFTFIDVLPPGRAYAAAEQAMTVYRALLHLAACGLPGITVDQENRQAIWEQVLRVEPVEETDTLRHYQLTIEDNAARDAFLSFWRIFSAVRVYRQLGTAQAEAVCSTLFTGWSIGMNWSEALDAALSDTLADQLQVLNRDEQRVLLAFVTYAGEPEQFAEQVRYILDTMPAVRQMAHQAHLRAVDPEPGNDPVDDSDASRLTAGQLGRLFDLGDPLLLPANGLFARRLTAFINERGL